MMPPSHLQPMSSSHRRNSSAPLLVAVTRTPGILSIKTPPQPRPRHPQQPHQHNGQHRNKQKPAPSAQRSPQLAQADKLINEAPSAAAPPDTQDTQAAMPVQIPEKFARGRQKAKFSRDKSIRSGTSPSRARRGARQPSPPISSSQAEVVGPYKPKQRNKHHPNVHSDSASLNAFDPFLDSDSDQPQATFNTPPVRSTPTIAPRPNGSIASRRKRRQCPPSPTPAPTKAAWNPTLSTPAMPIPNSSARNVEPFPQLSRSDPSRTTRPWDEFPICDDTTDFGDDDTSTAVPSSFAAREQYKRTPQLPTQQYDDGPHTAPLLSTYTWHAGTPYTPSPRRHHQRTTSGGVFFLSLDEESSATSDSSEDLKTLPKFSEKTRKTFFANSMFQNSPSPDDLPPPSFGSLA